MTVHSEVCKANIHVIQEHQCCKQLSPATISRRPAEVEWWYLHFYLRDLGPQADCLLKANPLVAGARVVVVTSAIFLKMVKILDCLNATKIIILNDVKLYNITIIVH